MHTGNQAKTRSSNPQKGNRPKLFKARFMVYQHEGTLDLESTKRVETTVTMTLPPRVTI